MFSFINIFHLIILLLVIYNGLASISDLESKNKTAGQNNSGEIKNGSIKQPVVAIEGGGISATPQHVSNETTPKTLGRERVTEKMDLKTFNTTKIMQNSTTEKIIPVTEKVTPIEEEHKKTVPRKGVQFNDISEANKTTINDFNLNKTDTHKINTNKTITTKHPKKPLFTEGVGEEPFAPSHFVSSKSKNISIPKVPQMESYGYPTQTKDGSEYIVPIIGVILSVPLVAIIINVVYKRSKEWWHHRHYRRMDFLIDGMYNHS